MGFIRNRVGDDALAEDVLQETYLRAQRQDDSHAVQYPKAYLYRIANNLIIDAQRKQQRQSEVPLERASEEIDPRSPERQTLVEEQLKQVTLAIN